MTTFKKLPKTSPNDTPTPIQNQAGSSKTVTLAAAYTGRTSSRGRADTGHIERLEIFSQGGWEDGRSARREVLGFESRNDAMRLRSFRAALRGSNNKNLADLPSSL
jgi:hypothetical protein